MDSMSYDEVIRRLAEIQRWSGVRDAKDKHALQCAIEDLELLRDTIEQQKVVHHAQPETGYATMAGPAEAPVDMVNHPPHYNTHPKGIECIDVIESMPYNVACAIKYLWRAGEKGEFDNWIQDLEKAIWYAKRRQGELIEEEVNLHPERFGCSTPEQMR